MRRMVVGPAGRLEPARAAGTGFSPKRQRQAALSRICLRSSAILIAAPLFAAGLSANGYAKTLAVGFSSSDRPARPASVSLFRPTQVVRP